MTELTATVTTRDRILDAAERLFAEYGYDGASLRDITAEASVNLAAVNYHFRSKEALMQAVFARRLTPLNRRRLALLDACEAAAGGGRPALERIVESLVVPVLQLGREDPAEAAILRKLMGRVFVDPDGHIQRLLDEEFREVVRRFRAAFLRALPELSREELFWRIHFSLGATVSVLTGAPFLEIVSDGRCHLSDLHEAPGRLVAYICGGLRAPVRAGRMSRRSRERPGARRQSGPNHQKRS